MQIEKYVKNYIDGNFSPASTSDYLESINPANGRLLTSFPDSAEEDIQRAVEAAERAQPAWSAMDQQKRFRILMRIADIIEQFNDAFARAETLDTGKPYTMAHSVDIPGAFQHFRFFATSVLHYSSKNYSIQNEANNYTRRQPIGIVGCIVSWHMPLHELTWKVAPALATGNCVVVKVSEHTPATAHLFCKACNEAKLPPGVLNIVFGKDETINPILAAHPKIYALTFTGQFEQGQKIIAASMPQVKKLNLVLGGKSPNIIFEDCDFDQMMINTLRSSFSNNGQHPYACSRIYVEEPLYEKFKAELIKRTSFLKIGDPFSTITDLGAIISNDQLEKLQGYIELAQQEGGEVLQGGKVIEMQGDLSGGFFFRPAIIEGLPLACQINQEELLGPIVTIAPFQNEAEALKLANGTDYGMAASVWSQNISKASRLAHKLKAGVVWINGWMIQDLRAPFGGVKSSGLSRSGGEASLDFFTETQNICIKY